MIKRRLLDGRLHELHRGVYLVGHTAAPLWANEAAALLACGANAALSRQSAAALWSLTPHLPAAPVCVTVPPGRCPRRPRIEVHREAIEARDLRRRYGLVLTSPPRTILDLASCLDLEELERLVAEAQYRRLAGDSELREQVERNPGRRGVVALRSILDLPGGPRRTRSPAERLMLRLLRRDGLTGYETNAKVHGYEVDVLWRELGFAVEVDGYEAHSGRVAFERDRLKLAKLKARGVDVMAVTGRQLRDDPEGAIARLLAALERRRAPE
jgi:very-short-patch-repair endonuclease